MRCAALLRVTHLQLDHVRPIVELEIGEASDAIALDFILVFLQHDRDNIVGEAKMSAHQVRPALVVQFVDRLVWLVGRGEHEDGPIGKESKVAVVLDQMHRPVALVLEAALAESDVTGFADVAAVEADSRPFNVHSAPRFVLRVLVQQNFPSPDSGMGGNFSGIRLIMEFISILTSCKPASKSPGRERISKSLSRPSRTARATVGPGGRRRPISGLAE